MSQEYISDIVMKSPSNAYIQGMQIIIFIKIQVFSFPVDTLRMKMNNNPQSFISGWKVHTK